MTGPAGNPTVTGGLRVKRSELQSLDLLLLALVICLNGHCDTLYWIKPCWDIEIELLIYVTTPIIGQHNRKKYTFQTDRLYVIDSIAFIPASECAVKSLRWRHNRRVGVSNDQPNDCLLKRLFRRRSTKASKPRVTGLCPGNSPGTSEFPASKAELFPFDDVIMFDTDTLSVAL